MKIQKLFIFAIIFIFTYSCQGLVYAQAESIIVVNITQDCDNCLFKIEWENKDKEAVVEIIAPTGEKFGEETTPERITKGEGKIYINVGNAKTGIWKVNVIGEGLGKTEADAGELPVNISIDKFSVSQNNDNITAKWQISNWSENLHIQIYADNNKEGYDGVEVLNIWDDENEESTFTPTGLDIGYYYYYICVSDSVGIFTYAYSDTALKYEDMSTYDKLNDVNACMLNEDVYISWSGDAEEYKVMLYDTNTMELLDEAKTQDNSYVFAMPEGYNKVKAGVAVCSGDQLGRYDLYEVSNELLPEAEVVYPEGDYSNQSVILVNVSFTGNCRVSATLNGELEIDDSSDSGDYKIDLAEGDNSIAFIVKSENRNMRTFTKEMYVDFTPPQFALNSDVNNTVTEKSSIYLQGYTEAGATLYCNDEKIDLMNNYFSYKYPLKIGKNEIVMSVKDLAGNETRYSAIVKRSLLGSREFMYIIVLLTGTVLGITYTIIFIKGIRGRRNGEKK